MDRILKNLEPERVFYYFEELTKIPHGSGNTKELSDYCVRFAEERRLFCRQDDLNNVIIVKEATEGYEKSPAVMLQGHLDMVCEKEGDTEHDFLTEPLKLSVEGDFISAKGTTLGGDDGIAIAYCLALLEAEDIPHPRLECVFTTEEEVGMEGASAIDLSGLKSQYLLNLDSEEEGIFLASCAGGVRYDLKLPVEYASARGEEIELWVGGLLGGHSGTEIHKGRGNASILLGRILHELSLQFEFALTALEGGQKDNAITREAKARLFVQKEDVEGFLKGAAGLEEELKSEYATSDPGLFVRGKAMGQREGQALTVVSQEKAIFLLMNVPYGVQAMSMDIPGLVQTSVNLGVMKLDKEAFSLRLSIRSSLKASKKAMRHKLEYLIEFLGGEYSFTGDYPEWEYKKESSLRELLVRVYGKMFGKEARVEAIHAGLECGILGAKMPGLDCVSLGPDIYDIHTPKERLSIFSTSRMWEFLKQVLKEMKSF